MDNSHLFSLPKDPLNIQGDLNSNIPTPQTYIPPQKDPAKLKSKKRDKIPDLVTSGDEEEEEDDEDSPLDLDFSDQVFFILHH